MNKKLIIFGIILVIYAETFILVERYCFNINNNTYTTTTTQKDEHNKINITYFSETKRISTDTNKTNLCQAFNDYSGFNTIFYFVVRTIGFIFFICGYFVKPAGLVIKWLAKMLQKFLLRKL